jgi:hypothetical protein
MMRFGLYALHFKKLKFDHNLLSDVGNAATARAGRQIESVTEPQQRPKCPGKHSRRHLLPLHLLAADLLKLILCKAFTSLKLHTFRPASSSQPELPISTSYNSTRLIMVSCGMKMHVILVTFLFARESLSQAEIPVVHLYLHASS